MDFDFKIIQKIGVMPGDLVIGDDKIYMIAKSSRLDHKESMMLILMSNGAAIYHGSSVPQLLQNFKDYRCIKSDELALKEK